MRIPLKPALAAGAAGAGMLALVAATAPHTTRFEGVVLKSYPDPANVWTGCAGHTGPEVVPGLIYTPAECDLLLRQDLIKHAEMIRPCVPEATPFESQVAFLDFAFNLGGANLCGSRIAANLKAGNLAAACKAINEGPDGKPRWIYMTRHETRTDPKTGVKSRVKVSIPLPGLIKRRAWERAQCEKGLAPTAKS